MRNYDFGIRVDGGLGEQPQEKFCLLSCNSPKTPPVSEINCIN